MNYASGLMMGTAIVQGFRQFFGNGSGFAAGGGRGTKWRKKTYEPQNNFNFQPLMPAKKQNMELVSSLPGRRRYRMANIAESQAEMFESVLNGVSYINEVKISHISGSILILYDEEYAKQLDSLMDAVKSKIFKHEAAAPRTNFYPVPAASYADPPVGSITMSIKNTMRAFSAWIGRNSFGLLDAGSLASLLFLIRGVRKMILNNERLNGTQMIWWAVSLMRGWRAI